MRFTEIVEKRLDEIEKKQTLEMTKEKEILRQQLELLAERSRYCDDNILIGITQTMISLYLVLSSSDFSLL